MNVFIIALAMILAGAGVLAFQRSGRRKFETILAACGIVLLGCGLAVARDATIGSTSILWVLTPGTPVVAAL